MMAVLQNALTDIRQRVSLLGSFYCTMFNEPFQLLRMLAADGLAEEQTAVDFAELQQISSRQRCPLYHTVLSQPVDLKAEDFQQITPLSLRYGEGKLYGVPQETGDIYRYGVPLMRLAPGIPFPRNLTRIHLICDQPVNPDVLLFDGFDYQLKDGWLMFERNPFETNLFPVKNGILTLWLRTCEYDLRFLQKTYGEPSGFSGATSPAYKRLVNAVWDVLTQCPSLTNLQKYIGAVCDVPVAEAAETVEILTETFAATGRRVYFKPENAVWTVSEGETVREGEFLTDAVVPTHSDSQKPKESDVTLPVELIDPRLTADYPDGITFGGGWVPVSFDFALENDETVPTFPISGDSGRNTRFWQCFYENTGSDGAEILQSLTRNGKIRPAELFLALCPNLTLYRLQTSKFGPDKRETALLKALRRFLPPNHLILFEGSMQTYFAGGLPGTEIPSEARIRAYPAVPARNAFTFTAPAGTQQILIAIPASDPKVSSLWYDAGAASGEYESLFTRTRLSVRETEDAPGTPYTVYYWTFAVPALGPMTFQVTLK